MGRDSVRIHGVGLVHSPLSVAIVELGQNGSQNYINGWDGVHAHVRYSLVLPNSAGRGIGAMQSLHHKLYGCSNIVTLTILASYLQRT